MASHLPPISFTKEATNYARLCQLLVKVGSQVLREKFNEIHEPANLPVILNSFMPKLKSLRSRRILPKHSETPWTQSHAQRFHLRILTSLPCACSWWTSVTCHLQQQVGDRHPPAPTDHSVGADILRMRHLRNSLYAHVTKTSIDEASFNSYWSDSRDVLVRLGGAKYDDLMRKMKLSAWILMLKKITKAF